MSQTKAGQALIAAYLDEGPNDIDSPGWLEHQVAAIEAEARKPRRPSARTAFDLDVERLTQAMDDAYTYALVEDKPDLPFVDDIEGFWHPFAAKVLALLSEEPS